MVCILHTKKEAGVLGVGDVLAMGFQEYIYIYLELMMYLVPHLPFHNSFLLSYCTQFLSPPFLLLLLLLLPTVSNDSNPPVKGHHIPSQDQATWVLTQHLKTLDFEVGFRRNRS